MLEWVSGVPHVKEKESKVISLYRKGYTPLTVAKTLQLSLSYVELVLRSKAMYLKPLISEYPNNILELAYEVNDKIDFNLSASGYSGLGKEYMTLRRQLQYSGVPGIEGAMPVTWNQAFLKVYNDMLTEIILNSAKSEGSVIIEGSEDVCALLYFEDYVRSGSRNMSTIVWTVASMLCLERHVTLSDLHLGEIIYSVETMMSNTKYTTLYELQDFVKLGADVLAVLLPFLGFVVDNGIIRPGYGVGEPSWISGEDYEGTHGSFYISWLTGNSECLKLY